MIFYNKTNTDIEVQFDKYKFIVPKNGEYCFDKDIISSNIVAVPCKTSQTKVKFPFGGTKNVVNEDLICELVCSLKFSIEKTDISSTIYFEQIESYVNEGVKFVSLVARSDDLIVTNQSYNVTDSLKAKRKYKLLLLLLVYYLPLWICSIFYGIFAKETIFIVVGFIATALSVIFYKRSINNFEIACDITSANRAFTQIIEEQNDKEEVLQLLDEFKNSREHTKADNFILSIFQSILKRF